MSIIAIIPSERLRNTAKNGLSGPPTHKDRSVLLQLCVNYAALKFSKERIVSLLTPVKNEVMSLWPLQTGLRL